MRTIALIFLGGGLGSVARYLLGRWLFRFFSSGVFGTLLANILGSVLLGFLLIFYRHHIMGVAPEISTSWQRIWIPLLSIGFCGGFTTFSSYIMDVYTEFMSGRFLLAWMLLGAHLLLGFVAAGLGIWLALRLGP